jgi:hypothetical protein
MPSIRKAEAFFTLILAVSATAQEKNAMNNPDARWEIVNEFGGSKVYIDHQSISREGLRMKAQLRYDLNPPGLDKRNGRAVPQMYMTEEYDLQANRFRVLQIIFRYEDGTAGAPLATDPEWAPATGGNEKTLAYLRAMKQE